MTGAVERSAGGTHGKRHVANGQLAMERALLPFFEIAHKAVPRAMAAHLEHQLIVGRLGGFEQEDLDEGTRFLAEVQAGLDNLGIIEDHQRTLRQVRREIAERVLAHLTMVIDEQL